MASLAIVIYFFGQLLRIRFLDFSFPLLDLVIFAFSLTNLYRHRHHKSANRPFLYFNCYLWLDFCLNLLYLPFDLRSFFYLLRLTALLCFFLFPPPISSKLKYLFSLVLISNIIFGLIQYFLWPDLIPFSSLNWDPHTNRLVSTFLDPTFTGLIYLLFFINIYLKKTKLQITDYCLLAITYLAFSLTYSRSGQLAFISAFAFLSFKLKRPRFFWLSLLVTAVTLIILPRPPGESTNLLRTNSIRAKIANYQTGLSLFFRRPLFGYAYNNLFLIRSDVPLQSHSISGFDGSLLTILVTTGIIGFGLFILGLKHYFLHTSLINQTLLISIFVHSFFSNSLLYPWVLLFLFFR
jgi:hypothetical protein